MKWIWSRVKAMWLVVLSPRETFVRNQMGPSYLVPFVVFSLIYLILTAVQAPIQLEWLQGQISAANVRPGPTTASAELYQRASRAALISVPFLLLLRWLAHALLVWLTAQVFFVNLGFSKTLTVVAYAYVPVLMRDATACLILCLRDRELLMQAESLNAALGLNLAFPRLPLPLWVLAGNVNFFEIWFVALLAMGLMALGRVSRQKSLAVVLPVWLFVTLVQFGFSAFAWHLKSQLGAP